MKTILFACGSGVATSQTVCSKVKKLLEAKKIKANYVVCAVRDVPRLIKTADVYVSIVKGNDTGEYNVPVINGVSFLTGINQDAELKKILDAIKE